MKNCKEDNSDNCGGVRFFIIALIISLILPAMIMDKTAVSPKHNVDIKMVIDYSEKYSNSLINFVDELKDNNYYSFSMAYYKTGSDGNYEIRAWNAVDTKKKLEYIRTVGLTSGDLIIDIDFRKYNTSNNVIFTKLFDNVKMNTARMYVELDGINIVYNSQESIRAYFGYRNGN